jgi:hypothetical protein
LDVEAPKAASHDAAEAPKAAGHDAAEALPLDADAPKASHNAGDPPALDAQPPPKANHHDDLVMVDVEAHHDADLMDACALAPPAEKKKEEGSIPVVSPQHLKDGSHAPGEDADSTTQQPGEPAKQEAGSSGPNAAAAPPLAMPDVKECAVLGLDARPALQESTAVTGDIHRDNLMDACHGSNGPSILDNVLADPPSAAEEAATPASTAGLKLARRFTRSLLGNKLDKEAAASESQDSEGKKDSSTDLAQTPGRRFTRSLLKPKVEARPTSNLGVSEEPADSTSHTPPSVKKMEMKMSKKVDCFTKHPTNVRELLSTGLLEGMPVMYIIPHSKV